jgi:hypothetical protein
MLLDDSIIEQVSHFNYMGCGITYNYEKKYVINLRDFKQYVEPLGERLEKKRGETRN